MGAALIAGLVRSGRIEAGRLTAADPRPSARESLDELGIRTVSEAAAAVSGQDLVVLAVKPQVAEALLREVGGLVETGQILVSIMAGISTARIEERVTGPVPVVRAMPQTLVRLGAGATALCAGRHAGTEHLSLVQALFEAVGATAVVPESLMDAVTGLSGSGPAYLYTVIEALSDGGVRAGLPREVALKLAAQTALGAARMILESGAHPAVLRDQVTSPGGTTIAGLHVLEEKGLRDALISAVQAAAARAAELGR
jgi:pyrroline-5-carboxylate reductase